jgi:hypothetical protein
MARGSCLCNGVQFEIAGRLHPIGMCHCSLCRKVSGVASNATLMVGKDELAWLAGEDLLETYTREGGWHTTFCRRCGSPAPNLHPSGGAYWVPAGVLDDDPGVRVAMHIFVGSKASWDEIGGSAPQHDEFFPGAAGTADP